MKQPTFVIVGLGLLGGSLAGALRRAFPRARVIGVSRSAAKVKSAKQKRLITEGTVDLSKALPGASCVLICTPVDTIPSLVRAVDRAAQDGLIVTDVGSTKEKLLRWVEQQCFRRIRFVGSHPMAGSHLAGLEYADPGLYRNTLTFVTRHRGMDRAAFQFVKRLWQVLCGHVEVLDGKKHDAIVAEISHLPHLIAASLVHSVSNNALRFAGTGFRDVTRISQGDPRLWVPILAANRKQVLQLLCRFQKVIARVHKQLALKRDASIRQLLSASAAKRRTIG